MDPQIITDAFYLASGLIAAGLVLIGIQVGTRTSVSNAAMSPFFGVFGGVGLAACVVALANGASNVVVIGAFVFALMIGFAGGLAATGRKR